MKSTVKLSILFSLGIVLQPKAQAAGYFFTTSVSEDFTTTGVKIVDGAADVTTVIPITAPFFDEGVVSDVSVTVNLSASNNTINSDGTLGDINGSGSLVSLSLRLVSPDGTVLPLIGAGTYGFNTSTGDQLVELTFADGGAIQGGNNLTPGTFTPSGTFDVFNGETPLGNWVLEIEDSTLGQPKSLNSFTLRVTQAVPEPSSMFLFGGMAIPLLFMRRRKVA